MSATTKIHIAVPPRSGGSSGKKNSFGVTTASPPPNDEDLFRPALLINFCLPDGSGELYRFDRRNVSPKNHQSYKPSRSLYSLIVCIIPFVLPLFNYCNSTNKSNPLIATPDKPSAGEPSAGEPSVKKSIRPQTQEVPRDQKTILHRGF
ncbi:MAG: hypothetical protein RLZZ361_162 [Cyanobacteriota bacterium]|jgi:hypothetical protein